MGCLYCLLFFIDGNNLNVLCSPLLSKPFILFSTLTFILSYSHICEAYFPVVERMPCMSVPQISRGTVRRAPTDLKNLKPDEKVRILINAASCRMYVIAYAGETQRIVGVFPVAVGSPEFKSPMLKGSIQAVVWNPWWQPPDAEWARDEKLTPPGPKNPLGKVKLNIYGEYYIHGTNNEKSVGQAVSHGCIRMVNQQVIQLAMWLQDEFSAPADAVDVLGSYKNFVIPLKEAIPVEIVYRPVHIEDNYVWVYPDIYDRRPDRWKALYRLMAEDPQLMERLDPLKVQALLEHNRKREIKVPLATLFNDQTRHLADTDSEFSDPIKPWRLPHSNQSATLAFKP